MRGKRKIQEESKDWQRVQRLRTHYYQSVEGHLDSLNANRLERDRRVQDLFPECGPGEPQISRSWHKPGGEGNRHVQYKPHDLANVSWPVEESE